MIDWVLFGALGFLIATLLALLLSRPLWKRAVRMTTRRFEATIPMSIAEIQAEKDRVRAELAVELCRMEMSLGKAKDKAARQLVETNKQRVEVVALQREMAAVEAKLSEATNANKVLELTVRRRLPDLEKGLVEAKAMIGELANANQELQMTLEQRNAALSEARAAVERHKGEIDTLRAALEGGLGIFRGLAGADVKLAKENQRLVAEISRLKEELATSRRAIEEEDKLLRRELERLGSRLLSAGEASAARAALEPVQTPVQTESKSIESESNGAESGGAEDDNETPEPTRRRFIRPPMRRGRGSLSQRLQGVEAGTTEN
jgi:chromosome segregation ATPase